jgi:hypothetical protein
VQLKVIGDGGDPDGHDDDEDEHHWGHVSVGDSNNLVVHGFGLSFAASNCSIVL